MVSKQPLLPPPFFATLHIHVAAVTQHPGRGKKQTKDIIANLYGKSIKFRHLINLLTCLSPSFNLHYCLQMDLTHRPTTSLGRCNRHEQSSWIPEYSIYPGPSLPPPCHSPNAKKRWRKKIGYRKYARALSKSCKPCSGPPFLPSVALITRNYEQNWLNQKSPTMATSAGSHSGGKATLTGVFSCHTSLPHCHKTEPDNTG